MDDLIAYCRRGRWATLYGPAGGQKSFLLEYRAAEAAREAEPRLLWIPIPGRMTPAAMLRKISMAISAPYAQSADASAREYYLYGQSAPVAAGPGAR